MSKNKAIIKDEKKSKFLEIKINEYKEAFDIFDRDKTGLISTNDIIKIKKIFSYPISRNHIQKLINEIDISGDGKFDFKKFVTLMQKQVNYIDEKNEDMVMESFREEYLGNKRKREKINNNEISKYDNDYQLLDNYRNSIFEENEKSIDDISIKKEDNPNDNNSLNYQKLKLDNKNINKYSFKQNDNNNIYNYKEERNCEYSIYNKNYKKNKRKKLKLVKKANIISEYENTILINKKNLPKNIIAQIELKKNNISFIKNEKNNNNFSIRDNGSLFKQPISNFNSKLDTEFDFNNISNINPGDNSFASDLSLDFLNNKQNSNILNSKIEKTSKFSINKKTKDLGNQNEKFLDITNEKLVNKEIDFKNNMNIKNNDYYKDNQLKTNYEINNNMNNNLYELENNYNKKKNVCLNNNIIIVYNKYTDEINIKKKDNNYSSDKTEIKKEKIKIENTSKSEEKNLKNNIQILNTFEFIYKKNKKKEKIIKKAIEIPYLIIIEKKNLDMDQIKNNYQQNKIYSPETKKTFLIEKEKRNNPTNNNKRENNYKIIEINKNESIFLKSKQIKIKNKAKKNQINSERDIKQMKVDENNQNNIINKDKIIKNENKEEHKFSNIANIEFNTPIQNSCKVKPKETKNVVLQENTYWDEENNLNEGRNFGKINNKAKNDNIKGKEEELNTIDLLNGFNYLYRQKIK